MFAKSAVAITSLLAVAQALKVTSPAKGAEWDASKSNEITWDSVDTDPKSFDIVVVNQSSFPEFSEKIATVNTADGKYDLKDAKIAAGDNYRINFVSNDPQNSGILAQSQEFDFTDSSSDDKTSAAASSTGSPSSSASSETATSAASASASATASGMTTMTSATATGSAAASETSGASKTAGASSSASGTAAKPSATAPSSASALKSTFAIMGSVAVAAYMLF